MHNENPNLLLCLPNRINAKTKAERKKLSPFWQSYLKQHLYPWTKHIDKRRIYGDTNISRLTETSLYENNFEYIEHIKKIWESRNVLMIEGEKTRFGVGNDLFQCAGTVKRILGPAESAFDCYERILKVSIEYSRQIDDPLVLIALGPTATVLASDLADAGIQAIDIGHLDISYEHLRRGKKDVVVGKYTNEVEGGNVVADCLDEEYCGSILTRIV